MDKMPIEIIEFIVIKSGDPYMQVSLLGVNKLFYEKLKLYDYDKLKQVDRLNLSNRILFKRHGCDILGGYTRIRSKKGVTL